MPAKIFEPPSAFPYLWLIYVGFVFFRGTMEIYKPAGADRVACKNHKKHKRAVSACAQVSAAG